MLSRRVAAWEDNIATTSATEQHRALRVAIEAGAVGSVARLLSVLQQAGKLASVLREDEGSALIHAAVTTPNTDMLRLVVAAGATVNAPNSDGLTPLDVAVCAGRWEIVDTLSCLDQSLINARNNAGETALFRATSRGSHQVVDRLLERRSDANIGDYSWRTPLLIAVEKGDIQLVVSLLNSGADPNIASQSGDTPLAAAVRIKNDDAFRLLRAMKADPDRRDARGWTLLHHAANDGEIRVVRALLNRCAVATREGISLSNISEKGGTRADVNARCAVTGSTALILAIRNNHPYVVSELLAAGADPALPDVQGATALQWAIAMEHKEISSQLTQVQAQRFVRGSTASTIADRSRIERETDNLEVPQTKQEQTAGQGCSTQEPLPHVGIHSAHCRTLFVNREPELPSGSRAAEGRCAPNRHISRNPVGGHNARCVVS